MADLRFDNPKTTEDFRALCQEVSPLPWSVGTGQLSCSIVDANGVEVAEFDYRSAKRNMAIIILAVNTCGGFRAEVTK